MTPMIIAHISDSHICLPEPEGSNRLDELRQVVKAVNARKVDVVVHTGDVVHQGQSHEYAAAREILSHLDAPLYLIPGNKDRRAPMVEAFGKCTPTSANGAFVQYAVDDLPVRMIMLDTLNEAHRLGQFCALRLQHLDDMLGEVPDKKTLVFMHHPPFDVHEAPHPFQFDEQTTVERLSEVLARHKQIKAIYCGHSHRFARAAVAGIPASTIPAIAIDLRRGDYGDDITPLFELYEV